MCTRSTGKSRNAQRDPGSRCAVRHRQPAPLTTNNRQLNVHPSHATVTKSLGVVPLIVIHSLRKVEGVLSTMCSTAGQYPLPRREPEVLRPVIGPVRSRFFARQPASAAVRLHKIQPKSFFKTTLPVSYAGSRLCAEFRVSL